MLARPPETTLLPTVGWKLLMATVAHFRTVGLPPTITTATLPHVPENLRYRLRASLRALGLMDDDWQVQPRFHEMLSVWDTGPKWRLFLRGMIAGAYPYIKLDLSQSDAEQLHKAFMQHFKRDSGNLGKAEVLYLNLAHAAGIKLSEALQKRVAASEVMAARASENAVQPTKTVPSVAAKPRKDTAVKPDAKPKLTPQQRVDKVMDLLRIFEGEGLPAEELGAVMTLLAYVQRKAKEHQ